MNIKKEITEDDEWEKENAESTRTSMNVELTGVIYGKLEDMAFLAGVDCDVLAEIILDEYIDDAVIDMKLLNAKKAERRKRYHG